MSSSRLINLMVNSRPVQVAAGSSVLDALRAAGVSVPTLCYSPRFKPRAVCRMCLVDVSSSKKPVPACATPAQDRDEIRTDSEELTRFRAADTRLMMSAAHDCMTCEVSGACKLQSLAQRLDVERPSQPLTAATAAADRHDEQLHPLHDHTSVSVWRDMDKCIHCGLCVDACGPQGQALHVIGETERGHGRRPSTLFDRPLAETNCISCGQCTLVCPVGALVEQPHWHRVLDVLGARRRTTVVQVAPASRVAIGEEFGLGSGSVSTGKLVNALRQLGFDYVFDTNFAADLTIIEEAHELLARVKNASSGAKLPLLTSCCPGWINYLELNRPELLCHLSTTRSPQQMFASVAKHGPFAASLEESARGDSAAAADPTAAVEPYVVSVMPCTAKKDEAARPGMRGDVDAVLTTRELAKMIRARNIPFASLANDGQFDSPLGESTGAAQIFGASGGVMEAALRTAVFLLNGGQLWAGRDQPNVPSSLPLEFKALRGVDPGIKEATVPGFGTVAAVNGIAAAQRLLADDGWRERYLMVEVMACVGGCLGGGGEPKSDEPDVLERRRAAIYSIDSAQTSRRSHENQQVQQLYQEWLGEPGSHTAETWLHTAYHGRHPDADPRRLALARFLDAVDCRDGPRVAALFAQDGVWDTGTAAFGVLRGRSAIAELVAQRLPPNGGSGSHMLRHRFLHQSDGLEVVMPGGGHASFEVQLSPNEKVGQIPLISSLKRISK